MLRPSPRTLPLPKGRRRPVSSHMDRGQAPPPPSVMPPFQYRLRQESSCLSNTGAHEYRLLYQELDRVRKLVGNGAHFSAWTAPQPGQNWALWGISRATHVIVLPARIHLGSGDGGNRPK